MKTTTKAASTGTKVPFVKPTPKNATEAMVRALGKAIRGGIHGMIPSESEDSESVGRKLSRLNFELARSRASHNVSQVLPEYGLNDASRKTLKAYGTALRGYAAALLAIAESAESAPSTDEGEADTEGIDPLDAFFGKAA